MPRIGIIGSGFAGVAVATELLRHGHRDIRLWERAADLGGVWRDNTYPGAACDVPSPFYSFSFAPWHGWPQRYAGQREILRYLHAVAEREGVSERVRLGVSVESATWDPDAAAWTVTFADGATEQVEVLISAVGQLSTPVIPDLPGAADFAGDSFHTARWPEGFDPAGREIAVIGSAATAVQLVPALAESAARVHVLQRTPNYIWWKPDGDYAPWYRPWSRIERPFFRWLGEQFSRAIEEGSFAARVSRGVTQWQLKRQVKDAALRRALTPDYPIGCKRILFSNDYYPALQRPNVDLVTERIQRLEPEGVRLADGRMLRADTVVYATGFAAQSFLHGIRITGSVGEELHDRWAEGARAHRGMYVPGFPNLVLMYGPNTNLGGSSILLMLEAQAAHARRVIDRLTATGASSVEPTVEAEARWDDDVQGALATTAWSSCGNWYRHPGSDRVTSNWPGGTTSYVRVMQGLDPHEFTWDRVTAVVG
ncbi:NAD(P)/FAD-dependent oxidoreductase [Microbacterium sp. SS28]|uniref:flavin-containing monooxygenase n=1 Tax=Microbacterium sp. SS28 TaxID=2919948 RepID=UPI001FA9ED4B|nr:NAD(P)/FAD-dependent oxidoreductase [Microbacterium sp. SS28]